MSLREQRKKRNMTLHELADKSGVHYVKIHQITKPKKQQSTLAFQGTL